MRSKAIFMALLAFAFGAQAVPVSREQATAAARAWVARRDTFGVRFGSGIRDARTLTMANGVSFHAVRMLGGGTVITSGDTEDEPILAFTSSSDDLSKLDRRSPLWAILTRLADRKKGSEDFMAKVAATAPLASKAALAGTLESVRRGRCAEKWDALLKEGEALAADGAFALSRAYAVDVWENEPYTAKSISDVRVNPLVKTKWSQSLDRAAKSCYNYYTPSGHETFTDGNPYNIACGCVATAMAQTMRYFEFPRGEVEARTMKCSWNGEPMDATMKGGVYDWSKMDDEPGVQTADESRQEIGKLTYDAGVSVRMDYNANDSGMSGAFSFSVRGAFVNTFGYKSATYFKDNKGMISGTIDPDEFDEIRSRALQHLFYSNLDAGLPVIVGITGHEVVADGYGYSADGLDYVHINMGWAGSSDYWFLLPILSYKGGGEGVVEPEGTMFFEDATYNIFTDASSTSGVLSGRVLDDGGETVADAEVVVRRSGSGAVVTNVTTSANGVWGVVVPAGQYDIEAKAGRLLGLTEGVTLSYPMTQEVTWNKIEKVPTVYGAENPDDLGNSWGNDIIVSSPAVEVNGVQFSTLDRAFAYAATNAEAEVKILLDVDLRRSITITNSCTITATNSAPALSRILPADGVKLTLAKGADVSFTNVVFEHGERLMVEAQAESVLRVSGIADLGEIRLADAGNLRLVGALQSPIVVDAPFAKGNGETFGRFAPYSEEAGATANYLLNKYDDEQGGECYYDGGEDRWQLRWKTGAEVPAAAVVARYEAAGAAPENYRSLAALFKYHPNGGVVAVLKDAEFTNDVSVVGSSLIYGAAKSVKVTAGSMARLAVGDGGSLVVSNLTFRGYRGPALFPVNGEGAELVLARNAVIDGAVGTENGHSGAVFVQKGTVTIREGAQIKNCSAEGVSANGGAVWLGSGCTLNLAGGKISKCRAVQYGGGIYAYNKSVVNVSGGASVTNNASGNYPADDIYLAATSCSFNLTGEATGSVGVRYSGSISGNGKGDAFIAVDPAVDAAVAARSCKAFFNDTSDALSAAVSADGGHLVWAERPPETGAVEPEAARDLVIYNDGTPQAVTNYYKSFNYAYASLTNDATIVVLGADTNDADVTVSKHVLIRAGDPAAVLHRSGDHKFEIGAGGSLRIEDIELNGAPGANVLLYVTKGGSLTLGDGARVRDVHGGGARPAGGIVVWGGEFRMLPGSEIRGCGNDYPQDEKVAVAPANVGVGGGLLVDGGTAYLEGGVISECWAERAAGVYIGNKATVYVSGDMKIFGNFTNSTPVVASRKESNLTVEKNAKLVLTGEFTGSIGVSDGIFCDTNVFGKVDADYYSTASFASLTNGAANFIHDARNVPGIVATNGTENALLVWSDAFVDEGGVLTFTYVDEDGVTRKYGALGEIPSPDPGPQPPDPPQPQPEIVPAEPIAFESIARIAEGRWRLVVTNIVPYCSYRLLTTDDLTTDFETVVDWTQAAADAPKAWTNDVTVSGEARFWKAEGKDGEKPVE